MEVVNELFIKVESFNLIDEVFEEQFWILDDCVNKINEVILDVFDNVSVVEKVIVSVVGNIFEVEVLIN